MTRHHQMCLDRKWLQQSRNTKRLLNMDKKMLKEKTTAELLELLPEDPTADGYTELVKRHYAKCLGRAQSILRNRAEAEDAVQDALVRAYQKSGQLREPARFPGWLDRIVVSCCMSSLRRRNPEAIDTEEYETLLDQIETRDQSPDQLLIAREQQNAVRDAINELPDKYQDPIRLYHLGGHSYKSIARTLDLPLGTVQSLISRARAKLETVLRPYANVVERIFVELVPSDERYARAPVPISVAKQTPRRPRS